MVRTINIRALKDKLSSTLRDVQRGEVVLVSDRGRVVAEIRKPTFTEAALSRVEERIARWVEQGHLRRGLPNRPQAYAPSTLRLASATVDRALTEMRAEG